MVHWSEMFVSLQLIFAYRYVFCRYKKVHYSNHKQHNVSHILISDINRRIWFWTTIYIIHTHTHTHTQTLTPHTQTHKQTRTCWECYSGCRHYYCCSCSFCCRLCWWDCHCCCCCCCYQRSAVLHICAVINQKVYTRISNRYMCIP